MKSNFVSVRELRVHQPNPREKSNVENRSVSPKQQWLGPVTEGTLNSFNKFWSLNVRWDEAQSFGSWCSFLFVVIKYSDQLGSTET